MTETSLRCCPSCGDRKIIQAGKLVYPQSRDWRERYCLICWQCNQVYRRGDGWQAIDMRRHGVEWRIERKQWEEGDGYDGKRLERKVRAGNDRKVLARGRGRQKSRQVANHHHHTSRRISHE